MPRSRPAVSGARWSVKAADGPLEQGANRRLGHVRHALLAAFARHRAAREVERVLGAGDRPRTRFGGAQRRDDEVRGGALEAVQPVGPQCPQAIGQRCPEEPDHRVIDRASRRGAEVG